MAQAVPAHHVPDAQAIPRIQLDSGPATFPLLDNLTGAPPRQATQVSVSRDAAHLYLLFECEDTEPWATITRRDGPLFQEEVVEVFIDPFGDLECYFEIEVNPINTVLDLMLRRVGKGWRKEFAWVCEGLETSVALGDAHWNATLVIPFAAMVPRPPPAGAVWRANFLRIDRPAGFPRELSAWSPTMRNGFHEPGRFGFIEF
jgi:hypothetical protein